ncbi:MAG: beta-phosphoglucomutase [Firmicutes bacterium]|nr:beta-phosphoglucomutase [Bacillota bacterium]
MRFTVVIFDLDGVIVSTDEYHYLSWKKIADREGIVFNRDINNRLRGVSRMESLAIILEKASREYSANEKEVLAATKNALYREALTELTEQDLLPGIKETISELKKRYIKIAIGSSSKNTALILKQVGLAHEFDAVVDGNDIKNSKPDPEVFLLAAARMGAAPEQCLVVEDADSGVDAAIRAGMKVAGVGQAAANSKASFALGSVKDILAFVGC